MVDLGREIASLLAQRDELNAKIDRLLCANQGHPPQGDEIRDFERGAVMIFCTCGEKKWVRSD